MYEMVSGWLMSSKDTDLLRTMDGNKIQVALFQGRTWIVGPDPVPGVNERRKHIGSRRERSRGQLPDHLEK